MDSLLQDIRYAVRSLRRTPSVTLVVVLTLALGIGANTAIFSLVDAVRAQALPYPDPDRLVQLWGSVMRGRLERRGASYPDYLDWRAQANSFEDIASFDPQMMTLAGADEPERIDTEFVSAPYFSLLRISPVRGHTFQAEEDLVAKPAAVIVMSDGLWKRRFGADPQIIGRTVTLNERPYTVVGLMPSGFRGITDTAELWVPFARYAPAATMANRNIRGWGTLARLKPGVSASAAQSEMDAIARRLEQAYPDTNEQRGVQVSPLDEELFGRLRSTLLTLMAAVAFVLLIACANVANLLMARSESRRREIAVRTAVGAGRGRLLRLLVTESCVLTVLGAAVGLILAPVAVVTLLAQSPVTFPSFVAPALDMRVAAFTIAVSLVCGIFVGLIAGWHATTTDLTNSLKTSVREGGGHRSQRLRNALVVAEVSLALVLLVGAGLMIRSVQNLAALDPGFDPDSVLTLHASIPRMPGSGVAPGGAATPAPPRPVVEGRVLLDRIRAVPGVVAASLGNDLPLDGNDAASFYSVEGQPATSAQDRPRAYLHFVSPDFFSTLRIPMVYGRTFADTEMTPASSVIIVSERVTKRFWPGENPIGKRLTIGSRTPSIVGVVGEVKYRGLPENPTADPDIYVPFADRNQQVAISVRTSVPPASLAGSIRSAIRSADASIVIYAVAPMDELIGRQTSRSRFTMWMMGVFAVIALSLAVIGIYGVMSYLVTQRTREIGIRMALGAEHSDVMAMVLAQGVVVIGIGLALGLAGASALARYLQGMLFDLTPLDPATFLAVSVLFAVVATLSSYLPARRAARVDPIVALRYE